MRQFFFVLFFTLEVQLWNLVKCSNNNYLIRNYKPKLKISCRYNGTHLLQKDTKCEYEMAINNQTLGRDSFSLKPYVIRPVQTVLLSETTFVSTVLLKTQKSRYFIMLRTANINKYSQYSNNILIKINSSMFDAVTYPKILDLKNSSFEVFFDGITGMRRLKINKDGWKICNSKLFLTNETTADIFIVRHNNDYIVLNKKERSLKIIKSTGKILRSYFTDKISNFDDNIRYDNHFNFTTVCLKYLIRPNNFPLFKIRIRCVQFDWMNNPKFNIVEKFNVFINDYKVYNSQNGGYKLLIKQNCTLNCMEEKILASFVNNTIVSKSKVIAKIKKSECHLHDFFLLTKNQSATNFGYSCYGNSSEDLVVHQKSFKLDLSNYPNNQTNDFQVYFKAFKEYITKMWHFIY